MTERKLGAVVRIPAEIHARLVSAAEEEGKKLGPWTKSTPGWLAARILLDWLDANYPATPGKTPPSPKKGKKA